MKSNNHFLGARRLTHVNIFVSAGCRSWCAPLICEMPPATRGLSVPPRASGLHLRLRLVRLRLVRVRLVRLRLVRLRVVRLRLVRLRVVVQTTPKPPP